MHTPDIQRSFQVNTKIMVPTLLNRICLRHPELEQKPIKFNAIGYHELILPNSGDEFHSNPVLKIRSQRQSKNILFHLRLLIDLIPAFVWE